MLDRSALERLRDGMDAEFVIELIGDFFASAPEMLAHMRQKLAQHQAEELRLAAHTLKANSASLGLLRLAELCQKLEELGKADQLDDATAAYLTEAEAAYEQARVALEAAREELSHDN